MANFIINHKYREKKDDIKEERARIIEAATNLIKPEIREKAYDNSTCVMILKANGFLHKNHCHRGAVVKGVEHISTIVLVNI